MSAVDIHTRAFENRWLLDYEEAFIARVVAYLDRAVTIKDVPSSDRWENFHHPHKQWIDFPLTKTVWLAYDFDMDPQHAARFLEYWCDLRDVMLTTSQEVALRDYVNRHKEDNDV